MDRVTIQKLLTAAKLLEKACATEYEPEMIALAEKSRGLLREVIVAIEAVTGGSDGGTGPRERRLLFDRRRSRLFHGSREPFESTGDQASVIARYQSATGRDRYRGNGIDSSV